MVEGDTLEVVTNPRQVGEALVGEAPVWQNAGERREEVKRRGVGTTAGVGSEEGRNHHVGAVLIDGAVGGVEAAAVAYAFGVAGAHITVLHALLDDVKIVNKAAERLAAVAVVGIAATAEGGANADGGHVEGAGLRRRTTLIHELHALVAVHGSAGVDVNLEIGEGFKGSLDLYVLGAGGGGRRCHAVTVEQPAALLGTVDVAVADEAESVVQTR